MMREITRWPQSDMAAPPTTCYRQTSKWRPKEFSFSCVFVFLVPLQLRKHVSSFDLLLPFFSVLLSFWKRVCVCCTNVDMYINRMGLRLLAGFLRPDFRSFRFVSLLIFPWIVGHVCCVTQPSPLHDFLGVFIVSNEVINTWILLLLTDEMLKNLSAIFRLVYLTLSLRSLCFVIVDGKWSMMIIKINREKGIDRLSLE